MKREANVDRVNTLCKGLIPGSGGGIRSSSGNEGACGRGARSARWVGRGRCGFTGRRRARARLAVAGRRARRDVLRGHGAPHVLCRAGARRRRGRRPSARTRSLNALFRGRDRRRRWGRARRVRREHLQLSVAARGRVPIRVGVGGADARRVASETGARARRGVRARRLAASGASGNANRHRGCRGGPRGMGGRSRREGLGVARLSAQVFRAARHQCGQLALEKLVKALQIHRVHFHVVVPGALHPQRLHPIL